MLKYTEGVREEMKVSRVVYVDSVVQIGIETKQKSAMVTISLQVLVEVQRVTHAELYSSEAAGPE